MISKLHIVVMLILANLLLLMPSTGSAQSVLNVLKDPATYRAGAVMTRTDISTPDTSPGDGNYFTGTFLDPTGMILGFDADQLCSTLSKASDQYGDSVDSLCQLLFVCLRKGEDGKVGSDCPIVNCFKAMDCARMSPSNPNYQAKCGSDNGMVDGTQYGGRGDAVVQNCKMLCQLDPSGAACNFGVCMAELACGDMSDQTYINGDYESFFEVRDGKLSCTQEASNASRGFHVPNAFCCDMLASPLALTWQTSDDRDANNNTPENTRENGEPASNKKEWWEDFHYEVVDTCQQLSVANECFGAIKRNTGASLDQAEDWWDYIPFPVPAEIEQDCCNQEVFDLIGELEKGKSAAEDGKVAKFVKNACKFIATANCVNAIVPIKDTIAQLSGKDAVDRTEEEENNAINQLEADMAGGTVAFPGSEIDQLCCQREKHITDFWPKFGTVVGKYCSFVDLFQCFGNVVRVIERLAASVDTNKPEVPDTSGLCHCTQVDSEGNKVLDPDSGLPLKNPNVTCDPLNLIAEVDSKGNRTGRNVSIDCRDRVHANSDCSYCENINIVDTLTTLNDATSKTSRNGIGNSAAIKKLNMLTDVTTGGVISQFREGCCTAQPLDALYDIGQILGQARIGGQNIFMTENGTRPLNGSDVRAPMERICAAVSVAHCGLSIGTDLGLNYSNWLQQCSCANNSTQCAPFSNEADLAGDHPMCGAGGGRCTNCWSNPIERFKAEIKSSGVQKAITNRIMDPNNFAFSKTNCCGTTSFDALIPKASTAEKTIETARAGFCSALNFTSCAGALINALPVTKGVEATRSVFSNDPIVALVNITNLNDLSNFLEYVSNPNYLDPINDFCCTDQDSVIMAADLISQQFSPNGNFVNNNDRNSGLGALIRESCRYVQVAECGRAITDMVGLTNSNIKPCEDNRCQIGMYRGEFCATARDCPINVANCTNNSCEDGARVGNYCVKHKDCPIEKMSICVSPTEGGAKSCLGGPNEGINCTQDSECARPEIECNMGKCSDGSLKNVTGSCSEASDCPFYPACFNETCYGGQNDGESCTSQSQCKPDASSDPSEGNSGTKLLQKLGQSFANSQMSDLATNFGDYFWPPSRSFESQCCGFSIEQEGGIDGPLGSPETLSLIKDISQPLGNVVEGACQVAAVLECAYTIKDSLGSFAPDVEKTYLCDGGNHKGKLCDPDDENACQPLTRQECQDPIESSGIVGAIPAVCDTVVVEEGQCVEQVNTFHRDWWSMFDVIFNENSQDSLAYAVKNNGTIAREFQSVCCGSYTIEAMDYFQAKMSEVAPGTIKPLNSSDPTQNYSHGLNMTCSMMRLAECGAVLSNHVANFNILNPNTGNVGQDLWSIIDDLLPPETEAINNYCCSAETLNAANVVDFNRANNDPNNPSNTPLRKTLQTMCDTLQVLECTQALVNTGAESASVLYQAATGPSANGQSRFRGLIESLTDPNSFERGEYFRDLGEAPLGAIMTNCCGEEMSAIMDRLAGEGGTDAEGQPAGIVKTHKKVCEAFQVSHCAVTASSQLFQLGFDTTDIVHEGTGATQDVSSEDRNFWNKIHDFGAVLKLSGGAVNRTMDACCPLISYDEERNGSRSGVANSLAPVAKFALNNMCSGSCQPNVAMCMMSYLSQRFDLNGNIEPMMMAGCCDVFANLPGIPLPNGETTTLADWGFTCQEPQPNPECYEVIETDFDERGAKCQWVHKRDAAPECGLMPEERVSPQNCGCCQVGMENTQGFMAAMGDNFDSILQCIGTGCTDKAFDPSNPTCENREPTLVCGAEVTFKPDSPTATFQIVSTGSGGCYGSDLLRRANMGIAPTSICDSSRRIESIATQFEERGPGNPDNPLATHCVPYQWGAPGNFCEGCAPWYDAVSANPNLYCDFQKRKCRAATKAKCISIDYYKRSCTTDEDCGTDPFNSCNQNLGYCEKSKAFGASSYITEKVCSDTGNICSSDSECGNENANMYGCGVPENSDNGTKLCFNLETQIYSQTQCSTPNDCLN